MVFIFSKYIIIEIVTVSAVKSCNRKGECFPKRHRRQTFFEGESSLRNIRYLANILGIHYLFRELTLNSLLFLANSI